jgi:hypothetical protein
MKNIKPFKIIIQSKIELSVLREVIYSLTGWFICDNSEFPVYCYYDEDLELECESCYTDFLSCPLPETNLHDFYAEYSGIDLTT